MVSSPSAESDSTLIYIAENVAINNFNFLKGKVKIINTAKVKKKARPLSQIKNPEKKIHSKRTPEKQKISESSKPDIRISDSNSDFFYAKINHFLVAVSNNPTNQSKKTELSFCRIYGNFDSRRILHNPPNYFKSFNSSKNQFLKSTPDIRPPPVCPIY